MAAPTNHWKLGLFVVIGFVLALSTVGVLGARSMTKEVVRYVSYFDESVQGLETGSLLGEVQAGKLSTQAQKTLANLDATVNRMNSLLARVDGDKGLLASFGYASDAIGDTVRNADGVGEQLQDTLRSVDGAARSIRKFTDALERDPDMLIKGRAKGNQ